VILFTLTVKFALYPLYKKSITGQRKMKDVQPQVDLLKEKFKNDPKNLNLKTLELYKENNINPFSSLLVVFIQIPVLIAVYFVFSKGLLAHEGLIYSFIHFPVSINTNFFGLDLTKMSVMLALVTGITQAIQARLTMQGQTLPEVKNKEGKPSFQEEFAKSMKIQMLYILPIFVVFIAIQLKLAAAITLYWVTANLFGIAQELYIKRFVFKNK
jgi:YidC/Oxa1 family membrane protein insertase